MGVCPHICPWVGSDAHPCGRQFWGSPSRVEYLSPQGVLLPRIHGTITSSLGLELRGRAAWQVTPSWALCRHACHQLLPWLWVKFAMVLDAARPGLDQWYWSTAAATGPTGRLGRPSPSYLWGVVRCALSLCPPWCLCLCGVRGLFALVHRCWRHVCSVRGFRGHLALVHQCARCVRHQCVVGGFVGGPSPLFLVFVLSYFFLRPFVWCRRPFVFALSYAFLRSLILPTFFEDKSQKGARLHCRHRRGQLEQRCRSAVFLVVVCVAVALSAVAPQGCGTRLLMYMGAG